MNNNGNNRNNPVENEYRSSQVYKTLSGIPAADKLAEGLGKAAAGLDHALNSVGPAVKTAAETYKQAQQNYSQTYRYNSGQGSQSAPGQWQPNRNQAKQPSQSWQPRQTWQPPQNPQRTQQTRQAQSGQPGQTGQLHRNQPVGRRPEGVTPAPAPQMPPMKLVHTGSPAKYYITGVVALLYALNAPMTEPANFAVYAIVLLLVFLLSGALFKGKKQFVPVEQPKPQPAPKPEPKKEPEPVKKSTTGNPEVDKIIDEGHEMIQKLRAANNAIPDEALSADIDRMERASSDIFNYIAKHPEKAPQIRKFMNYYLPTTLKLLNSYEHLSKQSVKGENITSTMFNIAGMMHTVADAFEKQLDSLFTDEAMDISADITVFETMLKQEGFVQRDAGPNSRDGQSNALH